MKTQLTQSQLWSLSAEALHDKEYRSRYFDALAFAIRDKNASILDTAGGTGFPSFDLYDAGFTKLSISDGDQDFAKNLQTELEGKGLSVKVYYSPWQELGTRIDDSFDVVVNADNSFVYMDGWMGGPMVEGLDNILERMRLVLAEFAKITKEGGLTIIGLGKHYAPTAEPSAFNRNFKLHKDGEDYDIVWTGELDWQKRIQVWTTTINSQSTEGSFVRKSYLVTKEELAEQMKLSGFKKVHILEPDSTRDNLIIGIK